VANRPAPHAHPGARNLILRACHVDPLRWPVCQNPMRVITVIDDPASSRTSSATSALGTTRLPTCPSRVTKGPAPTNHVGCGPDARPRNRADRLRATLWQAGGGSLPGGRLFAHRPRPSRLRGGLISTPTARRHGPAVGEHGQKLGQNWVLTPSARSGRMGPQ
jgi:hypothetical protein